jgi:hypothetical protein
MERIEETMCKEPPVELNSKWKAGVAEMFGIKPASLLECFFDVDGEPLIERLRQLAVVSASTGKPIVFQ